MPFNTQPYAPQGVGSTVEWVASIGTANTCVDAMTAAYGDSKYISVAAQNKVHLFSMPVGGYPSVGIRSVALFARIKSSVSNKGVQLGFLIGGAQYWSGDKTVTTTTTYGEYRDNWTTNPATGIAWTWSDIENLQFGIKSVNIPPGGYGSATPRCSQLQLIVHCDD